LSILCTQISRLKILGRAILNTAAVSQRTRWNVNLCGASIGEGIPEDNSAIAVDHI
jgi:hypothetical protein